MKELQELLAKLDKLTYIKEDSTSLETKEGFKVSLHTKFYSSKEGGAGRMLPSVQVKLDVRYKSTHIKGWGCVDQEDTKLIVDFFLEKKNLVRRREDREEEQAEEVGKTIFDIL